MRAVEQDQLSSGACLDLPLAVIDKYFMADGHTERFQFLTAKAICGRCAVQGTCLEDAIRLPGSDGVVRGGESGRALKELGRRYRAGEAAEALVADAIARQKPLSGAGGYPDLRVGHFSDSELVARDVGRVVVNSTVAWTQQRADN